MRVPKKSSCASCDSRHADDVRCAPHPSRASDVALVSQHPVSQARVVELDALRGLAALAVVAFHYTTHYGNEVGHLGDMPVSFDFGNYGVELFFLISGFVIFMTLERTRTAMDFVVSRFSRLFPAYWTAILLSSVVVYTIGMPSQRLPWSDVAFDFTMIQEILGAEHLDGSYWTLQVELFFYVQMLVWFMLGQLKRIHWIILAWLLIAVGFGEAGKHGMHVSYTIGELLIVRYIPFFAIGILFYRLRTQPPGGHRPRLQAGAAAGGRGLHGHLRPVPARLAAIVALVALCVPRRDFLFAVPAAPGHRIQRDLATGEARRGARFGGTCRGCDGDRAGHRAYLVGGATRHAGDPPLVETPACGGSNLTD